MKKILFTAVSALAMSAAMAADSTQFGILKVPSSAAQTIVSVPWLESGTGSNPVADAVKVADLVLTSGLSENDELRLYDNGSWTKAWKLTDGKWVGAQVAVKNDTKDSGDDSTRIMRGKAIMLIRSKPTDPAYFYIMGKPAATSGGIVEISGGEEGSPVYTLIAPPTTGSFAITDETKWGNLTNLKDHMTIDVNGVTKTWTYTKKNGWKTADKTAECSLPAGQGVWFYSEASGTKTLAY